MNEFKADLHCHSTFSDGSLSPLQLVQLALDRGLKGLSITDHDTVAAYPEVLSQARQLGLTMIPGVEFSAVHQNVSVHLLGYSYLPDNPVIKSFCEAHSRRRQERNTAILERLAAMGMPLEMSELANGIAQGSIGRPHIAGAMVRKGYVGSMGEAFKKFLREGGLCYAAGPRFTVEETIHTIRAAGGLAVIAHPHLIPEEKIVQDLLKMDFDGIEVHYAYFPLDKCIRWRDAATQKGWIATGGSDFHGDAKPNISLGSSWVNEETFNILLQRWEANQTTL